jgi:hypothetical protein
MTIYHTYIDDAVGLGSSTVVGIQTQGSVYGVGISTDIVCQNLNSTGITTASNLKTQTLNVSGVSTLGIVTAQQLIVSGISTIGLGTTAVPPSNSQLSFFLLNNTTLRIAARGTDGILRFANITLA